MAAQRITFSLHPQRLFKSHLRRYFLDSQPDLRGYRANSTIAKQSAAGKSVHVKNGNGKKTQATNPARLGETEWMTQPSQPYESSRKRNPYLFQFYTSLVIWLTADMMAQQIGEAEYDVAQTGRMLIIGGSASIPMYKW